MLMNLVQVYSGTVLYEGWPDTVAEGSRHTSYRHAYSMPVHDWESAGRPTSVHVLTEWTMSVPTPGRR